VTANSAKALALPLALLVAVEVWARATHLQSDSLAPPSEIAMALAGAFADLSILAATRDTLFSAFAGLAIGTVIGLALGIAFGISDTLNRLMEVTVESIRPIPSIALLPIALIALGFGYRMEIAIVAFACVWPILILSRAAVRSIEPRLMEVARALRLPPAHPGGVAPDLRGVSPVGRDSADRRGDRRDRDQPARPRRRHHAGATGAPP
jgi:ABC-type nitrate/sulfonate/bicarbonate transport system permease component